MDLRDFVVPFVDESGGNGGLGSTGGNTPARNEDPCWADAVIDTAASVLEDCSVIVGMHPDQATGSIIDCVRHLRTVTVCCDCGDCVR